MFQTKESTNYLSGILETFHHLSFAALYLVPVMCPQRKVRTNVVNFTHELDEVVFRINAVLFDIRPICGDSLFLVFASTGEILNHRKDVHWSYSFSTTEKNTNSGKNAFIGESHNKSNTLGASTGLGGDAFAKGEAAGELEAVLASIDTHAPASVDSNSAGTFGAFAVVGLHLYSPFGCSSFFTKEHRPEGGILGTIIKNLTESPCPSVWTQDQQQSHQG